MIGVINLIASTLVPSQLLKVVAQSPIVARGSLLPCMVYMASCPCGKRLIVALHDKCGQCPWGEGLIVALFDECGLLGVLALLTLGNVHAVLNLGGYGKRHA
jgi:hypothetical protein